MEAQIRAGHPDLEGLCRALVDWSAELRLLQVRRGLATVAPRLAHVRSHGDCFVSARAAVTWASQAVIGSRSRKARHGSAWLAWKEGGVRCYLLMR